MKNKLIACSCWFGAFLLGFPFCYITLETQGVWWMVPIVFVNLFLIGLLTTCGFMKAFEDF